MLHVAAVVRCVTLFIHCICLSYIHPTKYQDYNLLQYVVESVRSIQTLLVHLELQGQVSSEFATES